MRNRGRTIVSAVFLIIGIVFVVLGLFFWTGAAGGTGFPGMGSAEKEDYCVVEYLGTSELGSSYEGVQADEGYSFYELQFSVRNEGDRAAYGEMPYLYYEGENYDDVYDYWETPEDTEVYELEAAIRRDPEVEKLPSVVYVMQPQSQMEEMGYNDLLYGWDTNHMVPTFMHPNEVLDGALVSGSFMPVSSKWSTYDMQNCPNIKALYKEHGKTINFLGVIMSNLNVALDQKERAAQFVAQIATSLGADGAVVAEEGYGNPDADFVGCIVALEDAGVKTVGITNECTGRDGQSQPLVTLDEKCDAIVSCGNVSELIELPPMETVLGELEALGRDGLSGGWADDEILGPSVRKDGSIIMENNSMFCGDQVCGWSPKTMKEF